MNLAGKIPFAPLNTKNIPDIAIKELSNKRLFVVDAYCGANKDTRMAVRFICEVAWQAHFIRNMFIKPSDEELENAQKRLYLKYGGDNGKQFDIDLMILARHKKDFEEIRKVFPHN